MIVTSKQQSLDLLRAGAFGNRLRTWDSLAEIQSSGYTGLCTIRSKRPGSAYTRYQVPASLLWWYLDWSKLNYRLDPADFYFNESAPDDKLLIQGEVRDGEDGWYLYYNETPGIQMREAMTLAAGAKEARGLRARLMLKHYLTPSSFADLEAIFERFPGIIVEFSTYRCTLGDIPGRNTVIWEGRTTY